MPVNSAISSDLLVPPARLASFLLDARTTQQLTLSDIELRAGGAFSQGELRQIEAGKLALRDPDLRVLAAAYGIDLSTVVPCRATLVIDRSEGLVSLGESVGKFKPEDDDRKIMLRYLALVYRIRNAQPGMPVASRDDDLVILADVFSTTPAEVRRQLEELMNTASPEIRFQYGAFRNRLFVPAIGMLVALTAAGGLLFTSGPSVSAAASLPAKPAAGIAAAAVASHINIGSALTIERSAVGTTNIGDALVIERTS